MKISILFCGLIALGGCASFSWKNSWKNPKSAARAPAKKKGHVLPQESREIQLKPGRFVCFSLPDADAQLSHYHFRYGKDKRVSRFAYVHDEITDALAGVCNPNKTFSFMPPLRDRRGAANISYKGPALVACCIAK